MHPIFKVPSTLLGDTYWRVRFRVSNNQLISSSNQTRLARSGDSLVEISYIWPDRSSVKDISVSSVRKSTRFFSMVYYVFSENSGVSGTPA